MSSIQDLLIPPKQNDSNELRVEGIETTTVTRTTHFIIEFILDLICPYCYVALKNLDAAIKLYKSRYPEAVFEVVCTPLQLDPLAARSAYDKSNYLQSRNLRPPGHNSQRLASLTKAAGITFSWTGRTGNTRDAHKLLRFALESKPTTVRSTALVSSTPPTPTPPPPHPATTPTSPPQSPSLTHNPTLQKTLLTTLLTAHFTSPTDISSRQDLAALGAAILPSTSADTLQTEVLESEAWGAAIDALVADARRGRGGAIGAVPTLVVNDRYVIGGAQDVDFLVAELERIGGLGRGAGVGVGGARGLG